jgi:hypothetical protein
MDRLKLQIVTIFGVIGFLAACGSTDVDTAKNELGGSKSYKTGSVEEAIKEVSSERAAKAMPAQTETDRMMLAEAEAACKDQRYEAFFDAFIRSPAVRQKYSAARIDHLLRSVSGSDILRRKTIARADYADFPLKMVDYYRKPVKPLKMFDDEYVQLTFNQSRDNSIAVEWAIVTYQGPSEGGDDLGTPVDLDGKAYDPAGFKDGKLLFNPTQDCWELVADTRFQRI